MNTITKYVTIGIVITAIMLAGRWYSKKTFIPHSIRLETATVNVTKQSSDVQLKLMAIQSKTNVIITNDTLPGEVLAQTSINEDASTIIVDVDKVTLKKDRLEPVIAHEIFHVWEAYYIYGGIDKFTVLVNSEKETSIWENRSYEKTAIARENALRKYLKDSFSKEYRSMPITRELQNRRK